MSLLVFELAKHEGDRVAIYVESIVSIREGKRQSRRWGEQKVALIETTEGKHLVKDDGRTAVDVLTKALQVIDERGH